jgi:membrane protein DedA with SNARE-associated domain
VLVLLVCGDVIGDAIHYAIGRFGGAPLAALGRRFGLNEAKSANVAAQLRADATRMLIVGKWTHAIGGFVLIGAGVLRLNLAKFLLVNLLATVPKSAVLLGIGYFAGNVYPAFAQHVILGTAVLLILGGAAMVLILRRDGRALTGNSGR